VLCILLIISGPINVAVVCIFFISWAMSAVIRSFDYSRVKGRGKGVLGLKEFSVLKNSSDKVESPGKKA